jgi:hypothetical protein
MKTPTSFESFFDKKTLDRNNRNVTDINAGLEGLTVPLRDANISRTQLYLVAEYEENYPDLVANSSRLGHYDYWWWLLLINGLTDPLTSIKNEWVYSITDQSQIDNFVNQIMSENGTDEQNRVGETVELN